MASYPTSIKSWTTKYDQGQAPAGSEQEEINFAAHVNELQDEVAAVQTILGTNPHGSAATVKARVAALESGKSDSGHGHDTVYVRRDTVTTKGDLLVATGAAAVARVGVGTGSQLLLPNTGVAAGVSWRTLGHEELGNLGGKAHPDLLDEAAHTALHPTGVGVKPFVGMITPSARADIPAEWLDCNGQAVSRTTYSALFDVIGTTYGAGDGTNTFNVPDLRGRFPVGHHPTDVSFDVLNEKGGVKAVALTTAELPAHDHGSGGGHSHTGTTGNQSASHTHTVNAVGDHRHTEGETASWPDPYAKASSGYIPVKAASGYTGYAGGHSHSAGNQSASHNHGFTTGSAGAHTHTSVGSGSAHENLPPYIVLKFVIFAGA